MKMQKGLILLALCAAWSGVASGAVYWNNSQGDNSFANDLNWSGAMGGSGGEAVNMVGANQAKLLTGQTETRPIKLYIGNNAGTAGEMTVDGGDLTVDQFLYVGYSGTGTFNMDGGSFATTSYDVTLATKSDGVGTLYMSDGLMSVAREFVVGEAGSGSMTMSGGAINVSAVFRLSETVGSSGQLTLSGGTISARDFVIGAGTTSAGMFSISGTGKMILDGNESSRIQGYMDDGYLTGGQYVYDSDLGKTIVTAIPEPATIGMLMVGGIGVMVLRRSRR